MNEPYFELKMFYMKNRITQASEAKRMNMARATFCNKINRKGADFTMEEIRNICNYHKLDANIFLK